MTLIDDIRRVASFAEPEGKALSPYWSQIHFTRGAVFAGSTLGSIRVGADLGFECSVSAGRLIKALKASKRDPALSLADNKLVIRADQSTARIDTVAASNPEFPVPDDGEWVRCDLSQSSAVSWATADSSRPGLEGIHIGQNGLMACNGHALAHVAGHDFLSAVGEGCRVPFSILRDLPPAVWVRRVNDRLFIAEDESRLIYRVASIYSGKFPNIDRLVGDAAEYPVAWVDKAEVMDLIKRARIGDDVISLSISGNRLTASSGAISGRDSLFDFADSVSLRESELPEIKVGVDTRYLIPLVDNCPGVEIEIRISDPVSPIYVRSGDYRGVAMPMRI